MQGNFIEITLRHGDSSVNLLHISKNTPGGLLNVQLATITHWKKCSYLSRHQWNLRLFLLISSRQLVLEKALSQMFDKVLNTPLHFSTFPKEKNSKGILFQWLCRLFLRNSWEQLRGAASSPVTLRSQSSEWTENHAGNLRPLLILLY